MIDPRAELTPGLRAWFDRNRSMLSEIGVWVPVALYVLVVGSAVILLRDESSLSNVFANAAKAKIPVTLPVFGLTMHVIGVGIVVFGAFARSFPRKVRSTLTLKGYLCMHCGTSGFFSLLSHDAVISEHKTAQMYLFTGFSLVWLALAVSVIIDARKEIALARSISQLTDR